MFYSINNSSEDQATTVASTEETTRTDAGVNEKQTSAGEMTDAVSANSIDPTYSNERTETETLAENALNDATATETKASTDTETVVVPSNGIQQDSADKDNTPIEVIPVNPIACSDTVAESDDNVSDKPLPATEGQSYLNNINAIDAEALTDGRLYADIMALKTEFDRARITHKVRTIAKSLGMVKAFDDMITAARKDQTMGIRNTTDLDDEESNIFVMNYEGRNVSIRTGKWTIDLKNGVTRVKEDGTVEVACPHPITIEKVYRNNNSDECKAVIGFFLRGKYRSITVDKDVIVSPQRILSLSKYGIFVNSINATLLVKFFYDLERLNIDSIQEFRSTDKLGWNIITDGTGNESREFVPYDGNTKVDSEATARSLISSVKPCGNRDAWYSLISQIREKNRIEVLLCMAASFASILISLVGSLPFIVSLWGKAAIGKTIILRICASIWGDPREGRYLTDPKSTLTAMEIRLSTLNNLPMTVDDFAQIQKQFDDDYSSLIYYWCAGNGKERSNTSLGLSSPKDWCNCTITNGERSIVQESSQGGAIQRVIDVKATGDKLFTHEEANEIVNTLEYNYGVAGRDFVDIIHTLGPENINPMMKRYVTDIIEAASAKGETKADKQVVPMALMLLADEITEKYLFKDGIRLDFDTCVDLLKNTDEADENERIYDYLMNMIRINIRSFQEPDFSQTCEEWGFFDGDYVVIYSAKFDDILTKAGYQPKAFLAWAKDNNLLQLGQNGRPRKAVNRGNRYSGKAVVIRMNYGVLDQDDTSNVKSDTKEDKDNADVNSEKNPFEEIDYNPFEGNPYYIAYDDDTEPEGDAKTSDEDLLDGFDPDNLPFA